MYIECGSEKRLTGRRPGRKVYWRVSRQGRRKLDRQSMLTCTGQRLPKENAKSAESGCRDVGRSPGFPCKWDDENPGLWDLSSSLPVYEAKCGDVFHF